MIVVIGEILYDVFDDYERIGGAPANFAMHLKQLGLPVRLLTRVGDDARGRTILQLLETRGFDLDDVQVDSRHPTGTVRVALDQEGVPQFDIRTDVAYDYLNINACAPEMWREVRMVYIGSLVQRTARVSDGMKRFMTARTGGAEVFCDINLRPPHYRQETMAACLLYADILKLNTDELAQIQSSFGGPANEAALVEWIMARFAIGTLVLTHGAKGSTLYTAGQTINAAPPEEGSVVDTVGAGDAYAAVVAAGLVRKLDPARVVSWATQFAAHICTLPGAIPDDPAVYRWLQRMMEGKIDG
ncbi:MAG: carbohydrate kinase [Desulfatitalea sp.]|nr:carbohydrate kinase [Desulfatitalea sp.]